MTLVFYFFLIPLYRLDIFTSVKDSTYGLSLWVPDPLINRFSYKDAKISSKSLPNILSTNIFQIWVQEMKLLLFSTNLGQ